MARAECARVARRDHRESGPPTSDRWRSSDPHAHRAMKIEEPVDGTLVVTYDSRALTRLMLVFTAVFLGVALYDVFVGPRGPARLIGLLGAAATCLLVAVVFLETAWFEFVRGTRTITWRRRWALQRRSGSLSFAAVQSVHAERPMGDDGTPSRRIVVRTTDGAVIPLTVGYRPDPDGEVLKTVDRIRVFLGQYTERAPMQEAERLASSGRKIDAIRVLREEQGLSLTEAKQRVDELHRPTGK